MRENSTFKDIIHVTFANIINLASSVLNGFAIPIILGSLNYGYYKIFALYASYESLGHLGFNDGMMLSFSGKHFRELNKLDCRSNTIFFIYFQLILSSIIGFSSFFTTNQFYKILFILLGINNFALNVLCYYQKISQSTLRFDEFSIVTVIQNVLLIISVIFIFIFCRFNSIRNFNYIYYIIVIILINIILDIWYSYRYKSITFGRHTPIRKRLSTFKKYFISGAYITFGWGITLIMFNLDSQFVVRFFSVRTYGIYAFAYSIFSAGLIILQAASPVLLPHLKRHDIHHILTSYSTNLASVIIIVYLCIIGYFPLRIILYNFIPQYYTSLIYFRLLLPGIVITCCMNIIISSYYYALNKIKFYFYMSLVVLFLSFTIDTCVYLLFKSTESLAFASTLSLLIWFTLSNYFIVRWFHVKWIKNFIFIILMMILFLIISTINNWLLGALVYLVVYVVISLLLFKQIIFKLSHRIKDYIINLI